MKKILAIILSAVMLLCCLPLASLADDAVITYTEDGSFNESDEGLLRSGKTYVIPNGVKMTVPAEITLYVPTNATLRVDEGGKLNVLGNVIVKNGGLLNVEGSISGGQKVTAEAVGGAQVKISYPSFEDAGIASKTDIDGDGVAETDAIKNIVYCFGDTPTADLAETFIPFDEYGNTTGVLSREGGSFSMPLNKVLFLKAEFGENSEKPKFDPARFLIYFNGAEITYKQSYRSATVSNSGELSFSQWTNESDFYRTCKILLPTGEGYEIVGRDEEIGADSAVYIKYGQPFAFRVEVDEAYDMSQYQVYIYNGYGFLGMDPTDASGNLLNTLTPVQPRDGYYVIDKVVGDTTVYVEGMVKNETINLISSIIEAIRSIIEMIREFFANIFPTLSEGTAA